MFGGNALQKKKKEVDGEVSDGNLVNPGKEVHGSPREEKSGGKLLEEGDFDFVTRVVLLHNTGSGFCLAKSLTLTSKQTSKKKSKRRNQTEEGEKGQGDSNTDRRTRRKRGISNTDGQTRRTKRESKEEQTKRE